MGAAANQRLKLTGAAISAFFPQTGTLRSRRLLIMIGEKMSAVFHGETSFALTEHAFIYLSSENLEYTEVCDRQM